MMNIKLDNLDAFHLPVAKLGAPQTRHSILQILAEVKYILHGPFPLGLRVCGLVMQKKGYKTFKEHQNKMQ